MKTCLPGQPEKALPDVRRLPQTRYLRWGFTLLLLLITGYFLDLTVLGRELAQFSLLALLAAMVVSVAQVVLSAWRWCYTARRLGLVLPMAVAVREYYLATLLNQVLPGGVLGDVNRAWRHSLDSGARLASAHAVMIERLSGQLVMIAVALGLGGWLVWHRHGMLEALSEYGERVLLLLAGLVAIVVLVASLWQRAKRYVHALRRDLRQALLEWPALGIQIVSSAGVVTSYLAVFSLLALGAGYWTDPHMALVLMSLCSLLLLVMAIPVTVAGWGVREGAAALLWPMAGLPAEQGVALSVGYGLAVLLSSLPGALFVFTRRQSNG
ncbi:lysylphosphatidylglycerol synthase transmembrane domain-containing protein [Marinobacter algicola]|uniref:lysylphosphatidylglycerol synthase transmembrane domain-containing protein n=1 Tax=Marinobacter algicola TaxID=236100 RepID=UPI0012F50E1B|nr:lysylphosphatidylglycerol synthase transmembrane domain-containing protein [Marinobacter algicola]